ncbi:YwiB family protein [Bacillus atrophaeus]|uniref:DUF1934 domain-containing protein n=1 Tax=Bacillus atrophaeus TaxID=1452 RepID=UPI0018F7A1A6|nr:DUF1934 domain-containing protein [Bacillus atrophaeus]MBJ7894989.1 DUF1934 domain-containing protein [Bacillus atrophaeus]
MKQETPITLHVKSVIADDGKEEVIEFRTSGFYHVKQNKVYLSYYEEHDLGKVKTVVKVSESEVFVMRSGAVKMNQRFVPGVSTIAKYKMSFGELELTTSTKSIQSDIGKERGRISIAYDMHVGDEQQHLHNMTITYEGGLDA